MKFEFRKASTQPSTILDLVGIHVTQNESKTLVMSKDITTG